MKKNFKSKILQYLADQLAIVLYTLKRDHVFPLGYPLVLLLLSDLFISSFITRDILISTFFSIFFTSIVHLLVSIYIIYYVIPNKKKMKKFIKFISDHRQDPKTK